MKDCMLDIETLGTNPGSVVLSVAVVEFDLKTGETGNEFFSKIDLEDSLNQGFTIDPRTLRWWLEQNPKVLKQNIESPNDRASLPSIGTVILDMHEWFEKNLDKDVKVWGNSNRFDLGLLEPYFNKLGWRGSLPWKHYNERDVRTLVSFAPEIKERIVNEAKEAKEDLHNPTVDCKLQIKYCSEIYRYLTK